MGLCASSSAADSADADTTPAHDKSPTHAYSEATPADQAAPPDIAKADGNGSTATDDASNPLFQSDIHQLIQQSGAEAKHQQPHVPMQTIRPPPEPRRGPPNDTAPPSPIDDRSSEEYSEKSHEAVTAGPRHGGNDRTKALAEKGGSAGPSGQATAGGTTAGGTAIGGGGTIHPNDVLLLNGGVVARPVSIQLQQLNSQIKGLRKIGQGAGGVVYRGLWTGVPVAIKFMLSASPDKLNETAREAILARYVSHPNVVQTYTYDVTLLVESSAGQAALGHTSTLQQSVRGSSGQINTERPATGLKTIPSMDCSEASFNGEVKSTPTPGTEGAYAAAVTAAANAKVSPDIGNANNGASGAARGSNSLNIFDIGSRSTLELGIGSMKPSSFESDETTESICGADGWDMADVLLRLGASPGQYLTHIIMELCDAGTLQQAINSGIFSGFKSSSERGKTKSMLKTAREVARGMAHLHSLDIVHGDLKPGNILLKAAAAEKRGFNAKVADFGLARRLDASEAPIEGATEMEGDRDPIGTLAYMAPEAMRGTLVKGSDVYSFGIMLWQFCSGLVPFQGVHAAHIFYGKQNGSLRLAWPADTYSPVRRLAEMCMDLDANIRPTFEQICKALLQIETRMKRPSGQNRPKSSGHPNSSSTTGTAAPAVEGPSASNPYGFDLMPDPEMIP